MASRLSGKVAVITGTGNGIGRAAALRFASEGAQIYGCDLNPETGQETAELVRAAGGEMECLAIDLTEEAQTHRLMGAAAERFGGIDILYNNAMAMRLGSPLEMKLEDWNFSLTSVLTTAWLATKHAVPHLKRRGGGNIIFTSSTAGDNLGTGFVGNLPILGSYAVAKAGVTRLATLFAIELAQYGIRVNTISPGWIDVPSTKGVYGEPGSDTYQAISDLMLAGRLGTPDEVVEAALFFASGDAPFIVGANLRLDGGLTASSAHAGPDPEIAALFAPITDAVVSVDTQWDDK